MPISLASENFEVSIDPRIGGSVQSAKWRGASILDVRNGQSILASGCFPLVPFSNRIAASTFTFEDQQVVLCPNHPEDPACPVLHGMGWLSEWTAERVTDRTAALSLRCRDADWPWEFDANLEYSVLDDGFIARLGVKNCSGRNMPVGLGFHPYFPRNEHTRFHSQHRGEWQVGTDCIPRRLDIRTQAIDWWDGQPVETRIVDTVYTGREGMMVVSWPDRGIGARISPSAELPFTTVYLPEQERYFCVEPVSQMTDAFNRSREDSGTRVLAPGESWKVSMQIEAFAL